MRCQRCGCEFTALAGPLGRGVAYCTPCALKVRALRKLYILGALTVAMALVTAAGLAFMLVLFGFFAL